MKQNHLLNRISMALDLPSEPTPGQTVVELIGNRRVLIENHMGLSEYTQNEICIKSRTGSLSIKGNDLYIAKMTQCRVVICGCIDSIETQRRV